METLYEKQNPLFGRKEVVLKLTEEDFPPKKDEAAKMVAEKLAVPEDNIHIEKIEGKFGTNDFIITAEVYNSKEHKESLNKINKKKKLAKSK